METSDEVKQAPKNAQEMITRIRHSLMPKPGNKYLQFTDKVKMIVENRDQILKELDELKAHRRNMGFNAFNSPVVYFATVARHGFSRGHREGWYVTVRPFKVSNGQSHIAAIQRLEKFNKLVVGFELPTQQEWLQAAQSALANGATNPQAISKADPEVIKRYADMRTYCVERCRTTIGEWAMKDKLAEQEKANSELERRLQQREAELKDKEVALAKANKPAKKPKKSSSKTSKPKKSESSEDKGEES